MLHFSRHQRIALIILSTLIILFLAFPLVWPYVQTKEAYSFSEFEKALNKAKKKAENKAFIEQVEPKPSELVEPKVKIELFKFDPNTCSAEDFIKLGLNEKQYFQILNYRNKKGVFYKKEDFQKMYAIDAVTYKRLEAFISIPTNKIETKTDIKARSPIKQSIYYKTRLELNSAQEIELLKADWIGDYLSVEIPKYRQQLGGFVKIEQLLEVQGMREDNYIEIAKQIRLDKSKVIKLSINFINAKELERHPYFSKAISKAVMMERTKNGRYKSINDFKTRLKFKDNFIQKIEAYLEF